MKRAACKRLIKDILQNLTASPGEQPTPRRGDASWPEEPASHAIRPRSVPGDGHQVVGIRKLGPYSSAVVLTSPSILQFVNDYNAYLPVNFSPRDYPEERDELKRLIKSPPGT